MKKFALLIHILSLAAVTGCQGPRLLSGNSEPSGRSDALSDSDYTFAYWWNAFRKLPNEQSENLLCIESGKYGFMLDVDHLSKPRFGLLNDGLDYESALAAGSERIRDLADAELNVTVEHRGSVYRLAGTRAANGRLGDVRQWESGQIAQHYEVLGLTFEDDAGHPLDAYGRLILMAWPDSLAFSVELEPDQAYADGPGPGIVGNAHCVASAPRDIPHEDAIDPEVLTLEFWFKVPKTLAGGGATLLSKNLNAWQEGYVGFDYGHRSPSVIMNIGGGRDNVHSVNMSGNHFRKNAWNHVALTYDGTDMKTYLNGHHAGTKTIGKPRVPGKSHLRIGQRGDGQFDVRSGLYDEVRIWNRPLSPEEIKAHADKPDAILNREGLVFEETFGTGLSVSEPELDNAVITMSFKGAGLGGRTVIPVEGEWRSEEKKAFSLVCGLDETSANDENIAVSVTTWDGRTISADYDELFNCRKARVDRYKRAADFNTDGLARNYDDFLIEVENRGDEHRKVPVLIDFRDGFAITGNLPMLCHEDGTPAGLAVQLSKNWHDGAYKRPYMIIPAAPGTNRYLLRFAHGFYGTLPPASHAQLSLVGYGGNQRWDQLAVGCGGELITFNPDMSLAGGPEMVCDVRMTMAIYGKNKNPWVWTDAGWGGDWLTVRKGGNKLAAAALKVAYLAHGPCLSDVLYNGYYGSEREVSVKARIQLPRTDDYGRTYQNLEYAFHEELDAADTYLMRRHPTFWDGSVAYGNADGLIREIPVTADMKKGDLLIPPLKLEGPGPWWVAYPKRSRGGRVDEMPIGYVSMVIRAYEDSFGGNVNDRPYLQVRIEDIKGGEARLDTRFVPPPEVKTYQPGDYVKMDTVWLHFVRNADEFGGFNDTFREHLTKHPQSWETTYRDVKGSDLDVRVKGGAVLQEMPLVIRADKPEVTVDVAGGLAYIPVRFEGLHDPEGYAVYEVADGVETKLDQSVHGNDFWQTDFDAGSGTYKMTFNLPVDGKETSRWVLRMYQ